VKRTRYAVSATVTGPTVSTTRSKSCSSKLRDSPLKVTTRQKLLEKLERSLFVAQSKVIWVKCLGFNYIMEGGAVSATLDRSCQDSSTVSVRALEEFTG